ncbi:hydroxymethylbilane synthase [Aquimarina sp. U1-2]|uniref:hydroxymethylbilane synthase n=1 Tax=Aquimarina sp. U1-2 TaxID=2823141 RepID=UPI001AEC9C59|nr:hydroxymethylbilane synthase [Aquimarina sp. U1-2]MBP2834163.1 hydroxymethylbilane synthase [Aquimarina sp. U1-2]
MSRTIRIGTRDSELALWQAHTVQRSLVDLGCQTELIPVKSTGDIILDKPLYELGITGIFTKTLDIAMINGDIDIAVHSMKDVPTALPKGIVEAAVFKRASVLDILVHKGLDFLNNKGTIATGSLRRKAQWLHKYQKHTVVDLRGNVNTRIQKLADSHWDGAIFAAAGLERIDLKPENYINLDWMIPAPAQGAMLVVAKEQDDYCRNTLAKLNHKSTEICVHIEREFLRVLEGGCTAPIGALATLENDQIEFTGALFSLNGKRKVEVTQKVNIGEARNLGISCAQEILDNGGRELMQEIKSIIK